MLLSYLQYLFQVISNLRNYTPCTYSRQSFHGVPRCPFRFPYKIQRTRLLRVTIANSRLKISTTTLLLMLGYVKVVHRIQTLGQCKKNINRQAIDKFHHMVDTRRWTINRKIKHLRYPYFIKKMCNSL